MSNKLRSIGILLLVSFVYGFSYAQSDNFTDEDRARYICGFIRQVTWPGNVRNLTMGVLEPDTKLSEELRRQAVPENLRDKTLTVVSLQSLDSLPKLHLLFVNKSHYPELRVYSLMNTAVANGFLLISEAALFRQSMINFVAIEDKTYYEVNEQELQKAGFTYMSILAFGAIKNQEDWEALFRETRRELSNLRNDFEQLQQEVELKKQEIEKQEKVISDNAKEITVMSGEINRRQEQMDEQFARLTSLNSDVAVKQMELKSRDNEIALMNVEKQNIIEEQNRINAEHSEEIDDKKAQIENLNMQSADLNTQINEYLATLKMQNIIIILSVLLVIFLSCFGFYEYRNYKRKTAINLLLEAQNKEIAEQRDQIAHQNREITDSIVYARRIQKAVLPTPKLLHDYVDMYIFYRPRDIVSGDFYWMSRKDDKLIIVAADCTGHGVPGAFMSMLGVAFLNEIVNKENEVYANEILNKLRNNVIQSLNQAGRMEEEYTKDGMDIALCIIDHPSMTLQYSGAYNPLILIRNGEMTEIKADKMPVAYSDVHGEKTFTNNLIPLLTDDCIYMFSDGYADQFGGTEEKTKKFSTKRLKSTLLKVHELPMSEQEKIMAHHHDEWRGSHKQIDDVLLIGIRV